MEIKPTFTSANRVFIAISVVLVIIGCVMMGMKSKNADLKLIGVFDFDAVSCYYDDNFGERDDVSDDNGYLHNNGKTYFCTYKTKDGQYQVSVKTDVDTYNNWVNSGKLPAGIKQSVWVDKTGFEYYASSDAKAKDVFTFDSAKALERTITAVSVIVIGIIMLLVNILIPFFRPQFEAWLEKYQKMEYNEYD